MSLKKLLLLLLLLILFPSNAWAVTTFSTTFCSSGCDYTLPSTATAALDNAANIKNASNLAKTGSWNTQIGSNIADNAAITWDIGARAGTLIHMTATQYLIKCTTTTDCTNLGNLDVVTDGVNSFVVNGAPDSPIIRIECAENATFNDTFTVTMGTATNSDATNYMIVGVQEAYRHNGTSSTGCKVQTTANSFTVSLGSHSSKVEWLRIGESISSASNIGCFRTSNSFGNWNLGGHNLIIENCNSSGAGVWFGAQLSHSANTGNPVNYIANSIIYGSEGNGVVFDGVATGVDCSAWNNTVYGNGGWGFTAGGNGLQVLKNNLACANASGDYQGTYDTFTTSGSCDTTGSVAGLQNLVGSTEFVNTASDYHLKAGATSIDAGTDLGTTPTNVQFDIDNYDRDTTAVTWDVGADEYVASGGGTPPRAGIAGSLIGGSYLGGL